jgi:hypothetical protein
VNNCKKADKNHQEERSIKQERTRQVDKLKVLITVNLKHYIDATSNSAIDLVTGNVLNFTGHDEE